MKPQPHKKRESAVQRLERLRDQLAAAASDAQPASRERVARLRREVHAAERDAQLEHGQLYTRMLAAARRRAAGDDQVRPELQGMVRILLGDDQVAQTVAAADGRVGRPLPAHTERFGSVVDVLERRDDGQPLMVAVRLRHSGVQISVPADRLEQVPDGMRVR